MRPPPPMSPMVLPQTNAPSRRMDCAPGNTPLRSRRSPSTRRRATASSSPKCRSAVASVTTGGMTVTGMRRAVAAATSISDGVIFIDATARKPALAAMTSPSTRSCSRQNRISCLRTAAQSSSLVSVCVASELHSTSAMLRSRSVALRAIGWVMNTLGRMEIRRAASAHPAHDSGDTVNGDLHAIGDALCGIEHAQHHGNAPLAGERCEVRGTAAELRHQARHARKHLAQRGACDFRHQDIARRDASELAFAVNYARASCSPAYACRMAIEPRMAQPYFVGYSRRLQVQRPRLEQFESAIVLRPFDFHWYAHDVLDLPQQPTQQDGLSRIEAGFGRTRSGNGMRAVRATDAMEYPARHGAAEQAVAAQDDAIRHDFALGDRRPEAPCCVQNHVTICRAAQAAAGNSCRHERLHEDRHRRVRGTSIVRC